MNMIEYEREDQVTNITFWTEGNDGVITVKAENRELSLESFEV